MSEAIKKPKEKLTGRHYLYIVVLALCTFVGMGMEGQMGFLFPKLAGGGSFNMGQVSFIITMKTIIAVCLAPMLGKLSMKIGLKKLMLFATLGLAIPWTGFTIATNVVVLYAFAALFGAASTILIFCVPALIRDALPASRVGAITGVVMSASGITGIVMSPVTVAMFENVGWHEGCYLISIVIFVLGFLPVLFVIKPVEATAEAAGKPDGAPVAEETVRVPELKLTPAIFFALQFTCCYAVATSYHFPAHVEAIFDPAAAAFLMSYIGIFLLGIKLVLGPLSDKIGLKPCLVLVATCAFGSCIILLILAQYWQLFAMGPMYAIGCCIPGLFTPVLWTKSTTTRAQFRKYIGMSAIFGNIGNASATWLNGLLFDATGSFLVPFAVCAVMGAICVVCALMIRKNPDYVKQAA